MREGAQGTVIGARTSALVTTGGVVLEFSAVTQTFRSSPWQPARVALDHFSLRVGAGQMVAILGANGSGKSTALRIAAGLLRASSGECRRWGAGNPDDQAYRKIGYVPDLVAIPGFLSVGEALVAAARLSGVKTLRHATVVEALVDRVGLRVRLEHAVADLSRGQAQRLGLAVALLGEPELLLLDEPLSALDDEGAARMVALLAGLRDEGRTVLLTAHRSPELRACCDRLVRLDRGRMVEAWNHGA